MATPLAASIGDVVSLTMLSFIATILYENIVTYSWLSFMILAIYMCLLPFWIICVIYNKYTKPLLKSGWVPVLSALFISGWAKRKWVMNSHRMKQTCIRLGGLVLDQAVNQFTGFVVFQPIINGIGGNLVSVQASKMSTFLHQSSIVGIVPPHTKIWENPLRALVTVGRIFDRHKWNHSVRFTLFLFCSSLWKNSENIDSDVHTRSNCIYLRSWCYPYGTLNIECVVRLFVHLCQFRSGNCTSHRIISNIWTKQLPHCVTDLFAVIHRPCVDPCNVEMENWSRQFGDTIPDRVGWSVRFDVFGFGFSFYTKRRFWIWRRNWCVIHVLGVYVLFFLWNKLKVP